MAEPAAVRVDLQLLDRAADRAVLPQEWAVEPPAVQMVHRSPDLSAERAVLPREWAVELPGRLLEWVVAMDLPLDLLQEWVVGLLALLQEWAVCLALLQEWVECLVVLQVRAVCLVYLLAACQVDLQAARAAAGLQSCRLVRRLIPAVLVRPGA